MYLIILVCVFLVLANSIAHMMVTHNKIGTVTHTIVLIGYILFILKYLGY